MNTNTKKKKSRVGLIILLILILAAIAVVVLNPFEQQLAQLTGEPETEVSLLSVKTKPVSIDSLQGFIQVNGDVVDRQSIDIYPENVGKLTYMSVKVGDRISADQVFARVDPSRPGANFKEIEVKSPVDGTVLAVHFSTGSTVSQQTALIRIGMLGDLEIETAIPERYVGKIGVGTQARATFQAYPDEEFSGVVTRVSPVLNPVTRTLTIGIDVEDPNQLVKVGMFPSVVLHTETVEDALIIDRASILYEGSQAYVYTIDNQDVTRRKNITLGLVVEDLVQVTSGLSSDERIVIQGQTLLTDGVTVRVVD